MLVIGVTYLLIKVKRFNMGLDNQVSLRTIL